MADDHNYIQPSCVDIDPINEDSESVIIFVENDAIKSGDELLIDLVRLYPQIYDKTDKNHKNQTVVNNSWQEIANIIGLSVVECRERFRRLKQYYSRERSKREMEMRSGEGASTRKTWELFKNLEFLDKHLIRRKSFASHFGGPSQSAVASSNLLREANHTETINQIVGVEKNEQQEKNSDKRENENTPKSGDELLIDLVRLYPHIYDKTNKNHKNKTVVNNSWQEIADIIGLSVVECRERFRRLKQYYSRERSKREMEMRSGEGASTRKTWELFKNLEFLDKHLIRRKSFASHFGGGWSQSTFASSHLLKEANHTETINQIDVEKNEQQQKNSNKRKNENTPKPMECFYEPKKIKEIDPLEQSFSKMNSSIEALLHNFSNIISQSGHEDDEDVFGKLVARELKKRNTEERELLKKKIMQILF